MTTHLMTKKHRFGYAMIIGLGLMMMVSCQATSPAPASLNSTAGPLVPTASPARRGGTPVSAAGAVHAASDDQMSSATLIGHPLTATAMPFRAVP